MIVIIQGLGPYSTLIKKAEKEIKEMAKKVNDLCGTYVISPSIVYKYEFPQLVYDLICLVIRLELVQMNLLALEF